MPAQTSLTVKKNDGTTDIIYVALAPASSDETYAQWRADSVSTIPAFRPTLKIKTGPNGGNTARRIVGTYVYPSTAVENTVTVLKGKLPLDFAFLVPQDLTIADVNEATAQFANLMKHALILEIMRTGYNAT